MVQLTVLSDPYCLCILGVDLNIASSSHQIYFTREGSKRRRDEALRDMFRARFRLWLYLRILRVSSNQNHSMLLQNQYF